MAGSITANRFALPIDGLNDPIGFGMVRRWAPARVAANRLAFQRALPSGLCVASLAPIRRAGRGPASIGTAVPAPSILEIRLSAAENRHAQTRLFAVRPSPCHHPRGPAGPK